VVDSEVLRWGAALATILAASLVAWRGPPLLTAAGFAVFTCASILWIAASLVDGEPALLLQNAVLLGINLFGLWRWARKIAGAV
jgi:hypothetical protein